MSNRGFTPRIVALGIQGLSGLQIAQRVGCSENHAGEVMRAYLEQGGERLKPVTRKAYRQQVAA